MTRMMAALLAFLCVGLVHAQSMYRWVDENGKVRYGDRPPAKAAGQVRERPLKAAGASETMQQVAEKFPVTLYVADNCTACREGAEHLAKRGIPFTQKTVATQEDAEALARQLGGQASVPSLQVGSRFRKGFSQTSWDDLLDIVGFPPLTAPASP